LSVSQPALAVKRSDNFVYDAQSLMWHAKGTTSLHSLRFNFEVPVTPFAHGGLSTFSRVLQRHFGAVVDLFNASL
jgi:hypothetical protein